MLTFRYHLVTLVAVFLALAVGVVVGSTFVGPAVVESLRNQVDDVSATLDERKAANDRLSEQNNQLEELIDQTAPYAVARRLDGTSVLVVADRGIDEGVAVRTDELLQQAGATAPGTLWLEPAWALSEAEDRTRLSEALGIPEADAEVMQRQAWRRLLADLTAGAPEDGVAQRLIDAGFIDFQAVGEGDNLLSDLADEQFQLLLASGPTSDLPDTSHIGRMAEASAATGTATVVAEVYEQSEDGPDRGEVVAQVRDDNELSAEVSTVDDLELRSGRLAAVLAESDLQRDVVGHYGYGPGAQRPLPEGPGPS